jgi:hypothetical protein
MNWKLFSKVRRSPTVQRFRFRPNLVGLEDRTLLSVVSFAIDPTQSTLTLSATFQTPLGNTTLQQQGPGSLSTSYEGQLTADVEVDPVNGNTITFMQDPNQNDSFADISGSWAPLPGGGAGNAPANYGGQGSISFVSAQTALRNLTAYMDSGGNPMGMYANGDGSFGFSSTQNLIISGGGADYRYSAGIFGSGGGNLDLTNQTAQNQGADAYFLPDDADGIYIMVTPVHVEYTRTFSTPVGDVTAHLVIDGSLTSYGPEPSMVARGGSVHAASLALGNATQPHGIASSSAVGLVNLPAANLSALNTQSQNVSTDNTSTTALGAVHTAGHIAAIDTLGVELFGNDGWTL